MLGVANKKILIVEDESDLREIVAMVLASYGFETVSVSNGLEALTVLRLSPESIGLVLTDLNMPVMNGREFLELKAADERICGIPAIVVTSNLNGRINATEIVFKPYSIGELVNSVRRHFVESESRLPRSLVSKS
jgi:CheY-like chemotaxis protein